MIYNGNPIITELLAMRGISEEADVLEFLSEKPQKTYDPFLLSDMKEGVDLILSTIEGGGTICVYGDYDADGITSVSLMMRVLGHLTDKLFYYVPSRFSEGYGLNKEAISYIKSRGADLILTVDCGSVSCDEVEFAKASGLDIIVTDHHSIAERFADCILINPKKPGDTYPFKELAGVGVAFKLAQALARAADIPKSCVTSNLDLVAVGTIGDIVPLADENRTLVKYGLRAIRSTKRVGLSGLIEEIGLRKENITSENVAFAIVPNINAAGRIATADVAVELMMTCDREASERAVRTVTENNAERRRLQDEAFEKCAIIAESEESLGPAVVIRADGIHEGIAGIVAGKLKDKYGRPVIIVTPTEGNMLKGTGRSIPGINLHTLLGKAESCFSKFGGHAGACGFLMKADDFDRMKEIVTDAANAAVDSASADLGSETPFDMEINAGDVTQELANAVSLLEPFGAGNARPVFKIGGLRGTDVTRIGRDGKHLRFTACDRFGNALKCVLFGSSDEYADIVGNAGEFTMYAEIENSVWNGEKRLQLIARTIEETDDGRKNRRNM